MSCGNERGYHNGMWTRALIAFTLAVSPALACKCPARFTPCAETAAADLVFVGTVESVAPRFLDAWNTSQPDLLRTLNVQADAARQEQSDANITQLRDTYLKIFPDLPPESRSRLTAAKSHDQLVKAFYFIVNQGRLIHLKVRDKFREGGDDNDKADNKAAKKDESDDNGYIDVWTPFDDCGVDFQVGETYVVYADNDEESRVISTSHCTRTRRISDAGEDLAYLFYLKQDEKRAAELEGFLTTNQSYQAEVSGQYETTQVHGAVTDAVVQLDQAGAHRYGIPDSRGRFVFDGLSAGPYVLNVYAAGYPRVVAPLAGPKRGVLKEKGCVRDVVLLPKSPPPQTP